MENATSMYYGIVRTSNRNTQALASCICRCFGTSDDDQKRSMRYNLTSYNYA